MRSGNLVVPPAGTEIVKKAKRKPGPVPRSVRWAKARKRAEQQIASVLPELIDALYEAATTKVDGRKDTKSAEFLVSFLLGKPAAQKVAPVDDHSLPARSVEARTIEQMSIESLSDHALAKVKAIMLDDLISRGIVKPGDSVAIDPSAAAATGCGDHQGAKGSVPPDGQRV